MQEKDWIQKVTHITSRSKELHRFPYIKQNFPTIVRGTVIEVELESAVALETPEIASE